MGRSEGVRRLIVNADDFGASRSINAAVIRAHREGILTTASLMVGGEAFEEAVDLARAHPGLGVGLHLTLVCGRSVLSKAALGGLVDAVGRLDGQPVRAGLRYALDWRLREPLRREIRAQFDRFQATGLRLDHLNGHLHLHLHPTVLAVWSRELGAAGIRGVRLTRDPLRLNARLARGRWGYRVSHAAVFGGLAWWARPRLDRLGCRYPARVFGLLQDGRVDTGYLRRLLEVLPAGDSEVYAHPSLEACRHELEALLDPQVRAAVEARGIQRIRYQDL